MHLFLIQKQKNVVLHNPHQKGNSSMPFLLRKKKYWKKISFSILILIHALYAVSFGRLSYYLTVPTTTTNNIPSLTFQSPSPPQEQYHPIILDLPPHTSARLKNKGPTQQSRATTDIHTSSNGQHNNEMMTMIPSRNLPFCPNHHPCQADWIMNTTTGSFWLPQPPSQESRISGYEYHIDNNDKRDGGTGLVHDHYIKLKMFYSYNAGDFLALYLGPMLSGRNVQIEDLRAKSSDSLALVGSIVHQGPKYSWGAGFLDPAQELKSNTQEIFAIRGPISYQQYQNHQSKEQPPLSHRHRHRRHQSSSKTKVAKVYGDAGTLMSWYYQPHDQTKRYSLCILQHFREGDVTPVIQQLLKEWKMTTTTTTTSSLGSTHIIDIHGTLFTIMDQLVQCEFVLSSTLHGLIFADSYGIPNGHLDLVTGKILGGYHKFDDYYGSVGRNRTSLILPFNGIASEINKDDTLVAMVQNFKTKSIQEYHPTIDMIPFWNQCPIHAEAYNRSRYEHYEFVKAFSEKFYKKLQRRPREFRTFAKEMGALLG